jgi:hypothetical protein
MRHGFSCVGKRTFAAGAFFVLVSLVSFEAGAAFFAAGAAAFLAGGAFCQIADKGEQGV